MVIKGEITLTAKYEVELEITEENFNRMSEEEQKEYIENEINWDDFLQDANTDNVEIEEIH